MNEGLPMGKYEHIRPHIRSAELSISSLSLGHSDVYRNGGGRW
ncbi:MAG: hypothetical protein Q7R93_02245 [bacterium]|nr:hypothetical protein [bacterium]